MKQYHIQYTAATHVGGRRRNEDNYLVNGAMMPEVAATQWQDRGSRDTGRPLVAAVCDGIGGGARGHLASRLALQTIRDVAEEHPELPPEELILLLAEKAQQAVLKYYAPLEVNGGCTVSMVVLHGDRWAFLNIGDSPAFQRQAEMGEMTELSQRHNLEWEKRRLGMEPEEGDDCCLMRYLGRWGCTGRDMAHVAQGRWAPGDCLLLCSDGVSNAFGPEELCQKMKEGVSAEHLVQVAAADPWSDNCTAICIRAMPCETPPFL